MWERLVELSQLDFRKVIIVKEATCQAVLLITKWGRDYCVIGLLEVV